jgi:hypothetical protein
MKMLLFVEGQLWRKFDLTDGDGVSEEIERLKKEEGLVDSDFEVKLGE